MKSVVLLETNEVPYRVLDHYVSVRPQSHVAKFLAQASQLTTICDDTHELDPWISWPTVHRGVTDEHHGIHELGQQLDRVDAQFPPIWKLLADAGVSTGVFGSIHSSSMPASLDPYSFYVPDFFSAGAEAKPGYIQEFQNFNLGMTRRSARNVDTSVPFDLLLPLLRSLPKLGVKPSTVKSIVAQLMLELKNKRMRIRRRSIQPLLMLDVFLRLVEETKPSFATFYTNHVAAAMHRYWAATFPGDYDHQPLPQSWLTDYRGELTDAMDRLDQMLGKLMRHADATSCKIVMTSSLGQSAIDLSNEVTDGFVSIRNLDAFMSGLGFPPDSYEIKPAMVPLTGVVMKPEFMEAFLAQLDKLSIDGARFVRSEKEIGPLSYTVFEYGFVALLCYFKKPIATDVAMLGNREVKLSDLGIGKTPHEDGVASTAHHCKEGILLVYDPASKGLVKSREEISSIEIAPALLQNFGVAVPKYMIPTSAALQAAMGRSPVAAHKTPSRAKPQSAIHAS